MSDKPAHSNDHGHDAHAAPAAAVPGVVSPSAAVPEVRLAANYSDGGHEIDYTPNRNLMSFLAVMVVLLVLSALGIYQLFVTHTEGQLDDAAAAPAAQLVDQQKRDADFAGTWGQIALEGKVVAYRMPFAEATRLVLADPSRFAAAPAPKDWIHPDDVKK